MDKLLRNLSEREAEDVRQAGIIASIATAGAAGELPPERACHIATTQGVAFIMSRLCVSQEEAIDFLARCLIDFVNNYADLHHPD